MGNRTLKGYLQCCYVKPRALPYVAYYFQNGPWRQAWVRNGFDPREPQNKDSRLYEKLLPLCPYLTHIFY